MMQKLESLKLVGNFEQMLTSMNMSPCESTGKYPKVGKTFRLGFEDIDGFYWFYETESFILDIHDFQINKEVIIEYQADIAPLFLLGSTYLKTAHGEWLTPYHTMTSGSMFILTPYTSKLRYLFHGGFPFRSIGIKFKSKMIEEFIVDPLHIDERKVPDIFWETQKNVTKPIEKIANALLRCNMDSPAVELFLEAKAKEWLSITIDEYLRKKNTPPLSPEDDEKLQNVADYLNDHYVLNTPQELLEKIAMMSGTKLKSTFKQKYRMSITEFTQRRRMNMAETLLSTTSLDVGDVARSVGYQSHSRFSTLYKKYKGIYPREVRKYGEKVQEGVSEK